MPSIPKATSVACAGLALPPALARAQLPPLTTPLGRNHDASAIRRAPETDPDARRRGDALSRVTASKIGENHAH